MCYKDKDKRRRFLRRERGITGCGPCIKTGGKLDPRKIYDEDHYEPTRLKASKYGQYGYNACAEYSSPFSFPVESWLKSKVGQNWDELYSELSRIVNIRSKSGKRFHEDVYREVFRWGDFNLDENRNLIVEKCDRWGYFNYRRAEPEIDEWDPDFVAIDKLQEYRKINGAWIFIQYESDCIYEKWIRSWESYREVIKKRTLGKKELKSLRTLFEDAANYKYYKRTGFYRPVKVFKGN